ncbi:MAG: hypothetical protein WCQ44_13440, partial [Opitutaceae bacterium]
MNNETRAKLLRMQSKLLAYLNDLVMLTTNEMPSISIRAKGEGQYLPSAQIRSSRSAPLATRLISNSCWPRR